VKEATPEALANVLNKKQLDALLAYFGENPA
jgi:hypothetical protein